jgi:hypothetical protein
VAALGAAGLTTGGGIATGTATRTFTIRIKNTASVTEYPTAPDLPLSTGGAVWITPGVYAVDTGKNPIFTRRQPASSGLEALADAGGPGGIPETDSLVTELEQSEHVDPAGAWTPADTVADPTDPRDRCPAHRRSPPAAPSSSTSRRSDARN